MVNHKHDWVEIGVSESEQVKHLYRCEHLYKCKICGEETIIDSSG